MRRAIGFEQSEIDRFAGKAEELCQWLEQQPSEVDGSAARSRLTIPPRLTAIAAILVVYGAPIILEGGSTEGLCWGADCHVLV
jgi:hypothetical protein